jgi:hypothetical protein
MDFSFLTLIFGPALVAAGVSGVMMVAGLIITARAVRRLRAAQLESDRAVAARISTLDRVVGWKHDVLDRSLADMKFKYGRDLAELNRLIELTAHALAQFHQIRDMLDAARAANNADGEAADSRPELPPEAEEDPELFVVGRVGSDHAVEEVEEMPIAPPTLRSVIS